MNFTRNISLVSLCLTIGFVACNCASTIDPQAILAQMLSIDSPALPKTYYQLLQAPVESEEQGGQVVAPVIVEEEIVEEELIDEDDEVEIDMIDDLDDEDWESIWGNEDEEDIDWIDDDEDWEDDFDYIDNKETADGSS